MEDALKLDEQIRAEEEAAAGNEDFLRARYQAWAQDPTDLALKKDPALVLCRGADPMDKRLALSYLRECWEVNLSACACAQFLQWLLLCGVGTDCSALLCMFRLVSSCRSVCTLPLWVTSRSASSRPP